MIPVILAGMGVGVGLWLIVRELAPRHPQLAGALARLAPANLTLRTQAPARPRQAGLQERVGLWGRRHLSGRGVLGAPVADLQLLAGAPASADPDEQQRLYDQAVTGFYTERILTSLAGAAAPALIMGIPAAFGLLRVPFLVPAGASVLLAVTMWIVPAEKIHDKAKAARADFARAAVAYLQMVAVARVAGQGASSSLIVASRLSDGWMFVRIRQELQRAQWAGETPWGGLHSLARRLDLPELGEIADIMQQAAENTSAVYDQLMARAESLDDRILAANDAAAAENTSAMVVPIACTGLVYLFAIMFAVMASTL
jgi:tight adherence protein C